MRKDWSSVFQPPFGDRGNYALNLQILYLVGKLVNDFLGDNWTYLASSYTAEEY